MTSVFLRVKATLAPLLLEDPITKLSVANLFPDQMEDWCLEATRDLTYRLECLTPLEGLAIGFDAFAKIARAREQRLKDQLFKKAKSARV